MPSVLLTNYYSPPLLSIVRESLPNGFDLIPLDEPTRDNIIKKAPDADYFLVGGRLKIDQEVIEAAPHLKMIQRTGVGLDSIDLAVLKEKGIPLYVNPGINARSVAEHTLMLILAVMRRLTIVDATMKSGKWIKHELGIQNHGLFGKTIGLIGLGSIGLHVAEMLRPFGVNMVYNKRAQLSAKDEITLNLSFRSLPDLLAEADIVSLHCPLTKETEKIIGWDEFSLMKPGAIIINTSRGKLIQEDAVIHYLKSGHLKGAGLDVYEQEPVSSDNELLSLANVVLTPHISGITYESFDEMMREAFRNIELFEGGNFASIEDKKLTV